MRCESALIRLDELRTGELDAHEVSAVREHLEHCPYCDGVSKRIAGIADGARSLYGEPPSSCAASLERTLFDRVAPVSVGGLDLWVAFSEHGLTDLRIAAGRAARPAESAREEGAAPAASGESFESFAWSHFERFRRELRRAALPGELEHQLRDALAGRGVEQPRVDLAALPAFERRVLETLISIPGGELRSYGWVAREAGRPTAVRAVGNVCARNPVPLVVPCHRVVPAAGGLGGYGLGPEMKRRMLEREGVDLDRVERLERAHAKYVKAGDRWYCFPTCRHVQGIENSALEPVRDERAAAALGLLPCGTCRPLVSAA